MKLSKARALQLFVDCLVVVAALVAAYAIRFEGLPPWPYLKQGVLLLPYLLILRIGAFGIFGVYRLLWRYISLRDLPRIALATGAASLVLLGGRFLVMPILFRAGVDVRIYTTVPYGVLAAELFFATVGFITVRAAWRMVIEWTARSSARTAATTLGARKVRALLLGAGSAGLMVAKEASARADIGFEVVGFLDDDRLKHGTSIYGYRVLGSTDRLAEFASELEADLAVITMASVPASTIRRLVELAETAKLRVQITPGLYEILSGRVNISKIRDVAIEDLLGRAPVELDADVIDAFVKNKVVLVTGAGGSIGSEMCRQVARYAPRALLLVDQAENPLFHIHRELLRTHPTVTLLPLVANVTDGLRMRRLFAEHRPQIVFHAAAHKHVPLMEANPSEAIRNNVLGTRVVADLSHDFSADAFVMVSTDKAVNPTSVMGATKRLAEMYVQGLAAESETRFITVRFGNVLQSEGSVVPIFREQIAQGGPVTVTHPEMKRYFMTIPEASQLVLQAGAMGEGGEIFILEMGQPVLIVNLARDLIHLSGYKPDEDIRIEFTGIRPGEKLYEEINLSEENASKTKHPRIWIGKCPSQADLLALRQTVQGLVAAASSDSPDVLRRRLGDSVPEYTPPATTGRQSSPSLSSYSTGKSAVVAP